MNEGTQNQPAGEWAKLPRFRPRPCSLVPLGRGRVPWASTGPSGDPAAFSHRGPGEGAPPSQRPAPLARGSGAVLVPGGRPGYFWHVGEKRALSLCSQSHGAQSLLHPTASLDLTPLGTPQRPPSQAAQVTLSPLCPPRGPRWAPSVCNLHEHKSGRADRGTHWQGWGTNGRPCPRRDAGQRAGAPPPATPSTRSPRWGPRAIGCWDSRPLAFMVLWGVPWRAFGGGDILVDARSGAVTRIS